MTEKNDVRKDGGIKKVIFVSAGQYEHKKQTNLIKNQIRYLNYGALGLATMLNQELGLDILVAQGDNYSPEELIQRIEKENFDISSDCECFLLSIPSNYSVAWCRQFCKLVKERFNKKIIVGGRWVIDNNQEWVTSKIPDIDLIIEGFGEKKLFEIFSTDKAYSVEDGSNKCFDYFNYELLLDYKQYHPSIEISRGCGSGCKFCADRGNKRILNKPVNQIMYELDCLDKVYGSGNYTVYFEAPHFCFEEKWCEELACEMKKRKTKVKWRCTTRVESVPIEKIGMLAEAGLTIIDIGLESASHTQLVKMNKTKCPEKYLDKALKILEECEKYGVWIKFNILFYAGETHKTIEETKNWLKKYKHLIKGISVSSLVYYQGAGKLEDLLDAGAKLPSENALLDCGYVDLDLSDEISSEEAKKIAIQISQNQMSQKDYFDIKSVSYFKRGYTYEEFEQDIKKCNPMELPFEIIK